MSAFLGLAGGIASSLFMPAQASAAAFTVDYVRCESGDSRFYCNAAFSGGSGSIEVDWSLVNGEAMIPYDSTVSGSCTVGLKVKATVIAVDGSGT
ncbi:hypothetical protein, partial [Amycolatopsis lurida]|uniref:hypothetical protein n=1 Tax=Amycolatopsis lurida TaxID=31959 RepID=UPI00365363AD